MIQPQPNHSSWKTSPLVHCTLLSYRIHYEWGPSLFIASPIPQVISVSNVPILTMVDRILIGFGLLQARKFSLPSQYHICCLYTSLLNWQWPTIFPPRRNHSMVGIISQFFICWSQS